MSAELISGERKSRSLAVLTAESNKKKQKEEKFCHQYICPCVIYLTELRMMGVL